MNGGYSMHGICWRQILMCSMLESIRCMTKCRILWRICEYRVSEIHTNDESERSRVNELPTAQILFKT